MAALVAAFLISACVERSTVPVAGAPPTDLTRSPNCIRPATVVGQLTRRYPMAEMEADLRGEQAKTAIEVLNGIPPHTSIVADQMIIFSHPRSATLMILVFQEGCQVGRGTIRREYLRDFIHTPRFPDDGRRQNVSTAS